MSGKTISSVNSNTTRSCLAGKHTCCSIFECTLLIFIIDIKISSSSHEMVSRMNLIIFYKSSHKNIHRCIYGHSLERVSHAPTIPAYTLPYVVGHSKVNHSDWLRTVLLRAVCYCSSVDDFHQERIYLELTCLISGYSMRFVDSRVSHFFGYFQATALRYSGDQVVYDKFRRQCFDFMDMKRAFSSKLQHADDNGHLIRFYYRYDFGVRCQFYEQFHQLWIKHFDDHPTLSTKQTSILLKTKHVHSLNALLAQQTSFC